MTFAQSLHRVLDHYFGDEAFERRGRKKLEKERLRMQADNQRVLKEFWEKIPKHLQEQVPQEARELLLGRADVRDQLLGRKEERADT